IRKEGRDRKRCREREPSQDQREAGQRGESLDLIWAGLEGDDDPTGAEPERLRDREGRGKAEVLARQDFAARDRLREEEGEGLGAAGDASDSEDEPRQRNYEEHEIHEAERQPREALESDLSALSETEERQAEDQHREERREREEPAGLEGATKFLARDDRDTPTGTREARNHRWPSSRCDPATTKTPAGWPSTSQAKSPPGRSARKRRAAVPRARIGSGAQRSAYPER